ncbi:hypothetical protein ACNI3K_01255 [Demequina sp. SO4-13]|uniref:hypothetical protein n=1 Tax=Demequina sp. SO4-13 TaxID=3401027 RepID=UPI003AF7CC58
MTGSEGFDYRTRSNGEAVIFHHGKLAKMMRDEEAKKFLEDVKAGDPQEVMGTYVGNDGQAQKPGSAGKSAGPDSLHGNGEAHSAKDFRRKTG